MSNDPLFIQETSLSRAWVRAFTEVMKPGVGEILPLVVSVTGFTDNQPAENYLIRQALDNALEDSRMFPCDTVANTIFPVSLWNPIKGYKDLFDRYQRLLPQIKKMEPNNRYGVYFERLIAFGPTKINQLEHIISTYRSGNHRRSALQASIFDPSSDHTNQRQRGFPCMQQITFIPYNENELAITGFFATQYLFDRAYGNYLGLCNLGRFIAHELGLQFTKMTCVAGVAKIGNVKKRDIKDLLRSIESIEGSA